MVPVNRSSVRRASGDAVLIVRARLLHGHRRLHDLVIGVVSVAPVAQAVMWVVSG